MTLRRVKSYLQRRSMDVLDEEHVLSPGKGDARLN
jgi:hypothetical protein